MPIKEIHLALTPSHGSGWSTTLFTTFPSHFSTHSRLVWVFQPDLLYLHQGIEQYILIQQYPYNIYYSILPSSHHIVMAGAHVAILHCYRITDTLLSNEICPNHSSSPPQWSNSHHTTQLTRFPSPPHIMPQTTCSYSPVHVCTCTYMYHMYHPMGWMERRKTEECTRHSSLAHSLKGTNLLCHYIYNERH